MLDLFGFWSVVSLMVLPIFVAIFLAWVSHFVRKMKVNDLTPPRWIAALNPTDGWGFLATTAVCAQIVIWMFGLMSLNDAGGLDNLKTVTDVIAAIATAFSGFFGSCVGLLMIGVAVWIVEHITIKVMKLSKAVKDAA